MVTRLLNKLDQIDEECGKGYHYCQGCEEITDSLRSIINAKDGE